MADWRQVVRTRLADLRLAASAESEYPSGAGLRRAWPRFEFVKTLRRGPGVHRRIGYIVLRSGLVTGVTVLAMTTQMAIAAPRREPQRRFSAILFLVALVRAFACIRRRHVACTVNG